MKHLNKFFLIFLFFLSSSVFLNGCKKEVEKTLLSLNISKHPEGGAWTYDLTAEITGKIIGPLKEIDVVIEWYWEDGNHEHRSMKSTETVVFNSNEEMTVPTEYVLYGYVFLNYYWIEVSWWDDDGHHLIESVKAYCTTQK